MSNVVVTRDRGSPPLWEQVLEDLRRRMAAGEFAERFPRDVELVSHYEVSRHTAREAVRHLQSEGLVDRRRGRGSFVVGNRIEQPVGTLYSLFRSIEALGMVQDSVVRYLEERHDDEASAMLACPGAPLLYLERVRLADGDPIALDCSWLPFATTRALLDADFNHTALYEQLATQCGIRLTSGWERIRPVLPDRQQRELLGIDAREPAFAIERVAFWNAAPVEWRHSVVRGDRFSFIARWESEQSEHMNTAFEPTGPPPEDRVGNR